MKKINSKKLKKIILILALLIVLLILILIIAKLYKEQQKSSNKLNTASTYDKMKQEMVMPNGIFMLKQTYKGNVDLQDFYRNIKDLSDEMIMLSKKDEKNLEKYYDKNKDEIKEKTSMKDYESFKSLVKYSKSKGKLKSLTNANIDTNSFEDSDEYLKFDMTLLFDSNIDLKFKVYLKNNKSYINIAKYKIPQE